MAISFPSKVITSLDVPEVKSLSTKFVYNFFVPDEMVNDEGDPRTLGANEDFFSGKRRALEVRVPRFIEFSFTPAFSKSNLVADNEFVQDLSTRQNVRSLLTDNLAKVQSELEVSSKTTSALVLQDGALKEKVSKMLNLAVDMRVDVAGDDTDKAKILNDVTSDAVNGNEILKYFADFKNEGVSFTGASDGELKGEKSPSVIDNIKLYTQLSDKVMGSILRNAASDGLSPFSEQSAELVEQADQIQGLARLGGNPSVLKEDEYTSDIIPISYQKIDDADFKSAAKVIGYVIDKQEILPDGTVIDLDPVIVPNATSTAALDAEIKYGSVYSYAVRAVALVQLQAVSQNSDDLFAVSGLVASRPSNVSIVRCIETTPPPPPADVNFIWDYREKKLNITWAFPTNPQRDIKRFQVFRRPSVDDPFELIIEYDFDDSEIPSPRSETPRSDRVIYMKNPLTFYIDDAFNRDSRFIYSLCCIDAHDYSSNYSIQFEISFDRYKNVLVKKYISSAGAPKPYPNFYLDAGLTSDSMKDSNHFTATIFFDPEYLSIVDRNNEDLGLLATDGNEGVYKLQLINVDRQQSKVVTINVEDLRTT